MFREKLGCGAFGGAFLGLLAVVASLREGKPWGESLSALPVGILIGIGLVLWLTRHDRSDRDFEMAHPDDQIFELQNRLRDAVQNHALMERQGNPQGAAYWRAEIAVIESQLRNIGA